MSILPFCATIYNPEKFPNLSDIIAPPYDVISPEERRYFLTRSRFNAARLILGDQQTGPYFEDAFYEGIAALLKQWHTEEILVKREQPGIFLLHQFFTGPDGERHLRKGFIALFPIQDYGPQTVRAHERTHTGPIKDRLRLTEASRANFSQIFFTYQDAANRINKYLDESITKAVLKLNGHNEATGVDSICYLIEDEEVIEQVQIWMEEKPVFIADGHHRYETLRQYQQKCQTDTGRDELDANYVVGYFSCAQDSGLKVYPTHRTLRGLPDFSYQILMDKIFSTFDTEPLDPEDIELGNNHRSMIMVDKQGDPVRLSIKESAYDALRHRLEDPLLAEMDTVILEELILKDLLKLTEADLDNHRFLEYHRDLEDFWQALRTGSQVGWIMNYPDNNLLFEMGGRGLRLPQKSTYYFPKLPTGFVIRELED